MSDNNAGVSFEFLEQEKLAQFNNLRNTNDRFEAFTADGGSWHGVRAAKSIFKFLDKILTNCFTLEGGDDDIFYPYLLVFHATAEDTISDSVSALLR